MDSHTLTAISPIDGRYGHKTTCLKNYFSEYSLQAYRVLVEINWFKTLALCPDIPELPTLSQADITLLNNLHQNFTINDAKAIKKIEKETQHDVKAIEYFIKDNIKQSKTLKPYLEFVHFGCTSEDINNIAYSLMIRDFSKDYLFNTLSELIIELSQLSKTTINTPMLSRTHGQPASPTTLGKEIANFIARLKIQQKKLNEHQFTAKFNGAVGNFNAHRIAYPNVNWQHLTDQFILQFDLVPNPCTTQIEPHDCLCEFLQIVSLLNTVLIDFCRDCWGYISLDYFHQKNIATQTGSSTMPHKINPIDFENAEGNLGLSNALLNYLSQKLPLSRWQRDLSDSTSLRNVGVAMAHAHLAYQSIIQGLQKLEPNYQVIQGDLACHWKLLAEAIQTIMRKHQIPNAYEQLKKLTKGTELNQDNLIEFIRTLSIPEPDKQILLNLSPETYIGEADNITQRILEL